MESNIVFATLMVTMTYNTAVKAAPARLSRHDFWSFPCPLYYEFPA